MASSAHQGSIVSLVEPVETLDAELPLGLAHAEFARRKKLYLPVVSEGRFVGVVSGHEVNETLGALFGHAFFGRSPLRLHVKADVVVVGPDLPLTELLKVASSRSRENFFEDIAVVSEEGTFLGLIPVQRLVRLQTSMLLDNLGALEEQRRELAERNRQMLDDLRMARGVQAAILPSAPLWLAVGGRSLVAEYQYEPSEMIGGDFFAFTRPSETSAGLLVCDVMGHGVRSALITTIISAVVHEAGTAACDAGQLLTKLNRYLRQVLEGAGTTIFVTAAYAVIDLEAMTMDYAQAGHPPALRWYATQKKSSLVFLSAEAEGPALGLLDDVDYRADRIPLGQGDRLMLYTDGVIEATACTGEEFGGERLQRAFEEAVEEGAPDVARRVCEAARGFSNSGRFSDDVCVLVATCERIVVPAPASSPVTSTSNT